MDKTQLITKFSSNYEQKILLSHIYDLAQRRDGRNILTSSNFLSESDCNLVDSFLKAISCKNYMQYGGYSEAERRICIFLPDYYTADDVISTPMLAEINYITIKVNKYEASKADISHRDVLGSLMGLGIERDSVGDIIAEGDSAVFVVKSALSEFIKDNLIKVSRYGVDITVSESYEIKPKLDYETGYDTVASMRLDAVVSSIFKLSRSSASEYISAGLVSVNGSICTKPDNIIKEKDKLSLRGKGKAVIDRLDGTSKKGRIRFVYLKYK